MLTNAVCTVVRADGDEYKIIGVYPCMWQETESYEVKKYGAENADKAAIFIPGLSADVKKGDCIFRGEIEEINVENALTVMSVTPCDYGSEAMRHLELGVS